jgi:hypothetical protein
MNGCRCQKSTVVEVAQQNGWEENTVLGESEQNGNCITSNKNYAK